MGVVTKAVAIVGVVAMVVLALVLIAPHVQPLKPIAQSLGLIEVVNRTVVQYQVVNHTVVKTIVKYINQTVPMYINRTVYVYINRTVYVNQLSEYYGFCSGRIVVLPNGTGWLVVFMLVNPRQYGQEWLEGLGVGFVNTTTHYAQFDVGLEHVDAVFVETNYTELDLPGGLFCYTDNYTVNGYWPTVCGDVGGGGPFTLSANASSIISTFGANTTQTVLLHIGGVVYGGPTPLMYMPCQLTITYTPNATAALWLPVTENQTLIDYWSVGGFVQVFGTSNPYDWTMGFWVWDTPS